VTLPPGFRSGFVTVVGRPNVGKSTLVNRLVGTKVVITSPQPQTTRTTVRGVRNTRTSQLVLLDTPGLHRPRTALGERTNERARATLDEVDVICLVIDATGDVGRGDEFVSELVRGVDTPGVLVVNKIDAASKAAVAEHLAAAVERLGDFEAYVPVSARTGDGVDVLARELEGRLPKGPRYYPEGVVTDQPELFLAAELLREQLLMRTRDEVPHSITIEVEELEDDGGNHPEDVLRLRAIVRVERESQKGIVIGRGGTVLKDAGTAARRELEALLGVRVYLETKVRVERDWQRRPQALDRLGY
jgi:GTP-binding protein Era